MAARHIPPAFEGRSMQPPGSIHHGRFPVLSPVSGHRPLEPLPPPELLENKVAVRAAEMEHLMRENQRLAATHVALRQELVAAQQEMQRLQAHMGSVQTESDIQIRMLLDKIVKIDGSIRAGESVKKDLLEAHKEAQSLIATRQDLTTQIQQSAQELQKAHAEVKQLPELRVELSRLRQEHQRLRGAFEYEKGLNMDQVDQMHAMEKNLLAMAREVEKLRAEVLNAEKRAWAPSAYAGTYGSLDSSYPMPTQVSGFYTDGYGRPHVQLGAGIAGNGVNIYGSNVGGDPAGSDGLAGSVNVGSSGRGGVHEVARATPSSLAQR